MTDEHDGPGAGFQPGRWWVPDQDLDYTDHPHRPRPRSVEIFDVTLREGPQHYPVIFNADDMCAIARASAAIGIRRIDIWPVVSEATQVAMRRIRDELPQLEMYSPCRPSMPGDLDAAERCGAAAVVLMIPSPQPPVLEAARPRDYSRALDQVWQTADQARQRGLKVVAGTGGSFRAHPDALEPLYRGAREASVEAVTIADSFGNATPWAVESLVRRVRDWVGPQIRVELHCHNDLGLATANSLSGLRAGADVAHAAINGYGERAGNAALEEVAVGAEALLGLSTGLDLSGLTRLCREVADITGIPLPHNKPVVGTWQSVGWSGLQVDWRHSAQAGGYPEAWFAIMPEVVGADPGRFELGPMVGGSLIKLKAAELGLEVPDALLSRLRDEVKQVSTERRKPISDDEFRGMVERALAPA
jgi:isopropylmalate/homocitrate/citramalate synthase